MGESIRVMKFGGSSVGRPERLLQVSDLIVSERQRSPVAVVVSAMGDTTDWLIEAAETAARGDAAEAMTIADRVADLAISNGLVAIRSVAEREPLEPAPTSEVTAIVRGF
ncbi:MAG: hypothetical protein AAFX99_30885, partial [Myxococcota bacterium]